MGGKKPLRRPLWPPTRATASNYYPLGLDGAGGAAKPLLRAPKKPAPLHGRLPAFSGAVDAFERARKCFLEWRYFFSIILSEFLKNRVALHKEQKEQVAQVESRLATIARQGRAFGIHLILATQRPDANILAGQIKNNIDCRICGRADNVLSQIILDSTDAADRIPKTSRGRFLLHDGTVFQAFLFDDKTI